MAASHPYEIYLITAPGYWYVGSTTRDAKLRFREHIEDTNMKRSCLDCDLVTTPGAMTMHIKASRHKGWVDA